MWGLLERRPWSAWSEVREMPRRRYEIWIACIVHGLPPRGPRGPQDPRVKTVHHHRHHHHDHHQLNLYSPSSSMPSLEGAFDIHVLGRSPSVDGCAEACAGRFLLGSMQWCLRHAGHGKFSDKGARHAMKTILALERWSILARANNTLCVSCMG